MVLIAAIASSDTSTEDDENSSRDVASGQASTDGESSPGTTPDDNNNSGQDDPRATGRSSLVTRVIDGDTIVVLGVGRARLIGIDTPERGEECYEESTRYLRRRIEGEVVRYRYQAERTDQYDRDLIDVFHDDQLVNLDIAEAGWGEELTIEPNDRYADRIAGAEAEARSAYRGKWAGCAPEPKPEPNPEPSPPPSPPESDDESGGGGGGSLPPPPPDLDCSDVDGPVSVGPSDPHRLDADNDGIGCE